MRDIRYGLRSFRRHPVVTAVAVLSLAVGIGAGQATRQSAAAPIDPEREAGLRFAPMGRYVGPPAPFESTR
jgi:hypothetical protein